MELKPQLWQRQGLSAVMQYGLQVLTMPYLELEKHIEQELLENPLIEVAEEGELVRRSVPAGSSSLGSSLPLEEELLVTKEEPSIRNYLLAQIAPGRLPPEDTPVLEALIAIADAETGLLPYEELAEEMGLPEPSSAVLRCLAVLRSLDPPGICAQDMHHALYRQLEVQGRLDETTRVIIQNCLPLLAQGHFGIIAKKCGTSIAQVRKIAEHIRACKPYPTADFSTRTSGYDVPDIRFFIGNGNWEAEVCTGWMGFLRISVLYDQYCAEATDEETRAYLQDKLERARRIMQFVQQRQDTLLRISKLVLVRQRGFLDEKEPLRPLSMKEAAAELGLHASTVGRAIRDKLAQTPAGIVPLRSFFSSRIGVEEHSASKAAVKTRIRELVRAESGRHALSDVQLQRRLKEEGLEIARRTVAKYRTQLCIPPVSVRRRK